MLIGLVIFLFIVIFYNLEFTYDGATSVTIINLIAPDLLNIHFYAYINHVYTFIIRKIDLNKITLFLIYWQDMKIN